MYACVFPSLPSLPPSPPLSLSLSLCVCVCVCSCFHLHTCVYLPVNTHKPCMCVHIHVYTMQMDSPRLKFLIVRDDLAKKNIVFSQRSNGRQQPAISKYSLLHIKSASSTNKQFRITAYVLIEPGGKRTTVTSGLLNMFVFSSTCLWVAQV